MGRDSLNCKHKFKPVYEDHILIGNIYYYDQCEKCGAKTNTGPGPLDLGTYK